MLILENQIVSPYLVQTALKYTIPIYYTNDTRSLHLSEHDKLLTNSESCLKWLEETNSTHQHVISSALVKDKAKFRELLSSIHKDYFYNLVTMDELLAMDQESIPFPVVIKPNKGYSSVGVYIVKEKEDWEKAVRSLYSDVVLARHMYSDSVLDGGQVIIEEWISGEEYALDCYFDKKGKPVILSALKRIFSNDQDTSDRIYFTSKVVVEEIQNKMVQHLSELNEHLGLKNYPFHMEVRKSGDRVIPIEMNPLRFAGIGTTDVSQHAYNIQAAEYYYLEQEPDWASILEEKDDAIFGFFCADIPLHISRSLIENIQHDRLQKEFSHILEYRNLETANDRTFAVIFFKAESMNELHYLLNLDLEPFIQLKPSKEEVK